MPPRDVEHLPTREGGRGGGVERSAAHRPLNTASRRLYATAHSADGLHFCLYLSRQEHLHNTEGFRRVDVVPLHFDHAPASDSPKSGKDGAGASRKWEAVMELLLYAVLVAFLASLAVARPAIPDSVAPPPAPLAPEPPPSPT